jgi:uncharacterized protein (TIGR03067 family)
MTARIVALLTLNCLVAAEQKDPAKDEIEKLQGDWMMVSSETSGKKAPDNIVKISSVSIKGDQWLAKLGGRETKFTIKVDPTKSPRTIDFTGPSSTGEVTSPGVYKLEGDSLTVCIAGRGKDRPKEFKSEDGSMLLVYKRAGK